MAHTHRWLETTFFPPASSCLHYKARTSLIVQVSILRTAVPASLAPELFIAWTWNLNKSRWRLTVALNLFIAFISCSSFASPLLFNTLVGWKIRWFNRPYGLHANGKWWRLRWFWCHSERLKFYSSRLQSQQLNQFSYRSARSSQRVLSLPE